MNRFSDFTTLGVGGPMGHYTNFSSTELLAADAKNLWSRGGEWLALGGGSNLVVGDSGFEGHVFHINTRGVTARKTKGSWVELHAAAGEDWDKLVSYSIGQGLRGLETMSGIPGTVGASVIQNIGAYGSEISDSVVSVDFLEHPSGIRRTVSAEELELGFRSSAIKKGVLTGIVLGVTFLLQFADDGLSLPIRYNQLAESLGSPASGTAPLEEVRRTVISIRASKGMILDESDPDSASAGSFFMNPIVSEKISTKLPASTPRWLIGNNSRELVVPIGSTPHSSAIDYEPAKVKLSAAWLIEHSGISKGFSLGDSRAAISGKHSLAIVNRGGAAAAEIAELARFIRTSVKNKTGIQLEPEPSLIGIAI